MTSSEISKFLLLRTIGNFLVLFSLYGVVATFGPAMYFELQYQLIQARGLRFTIQNPAAVSFATQKTENPDVSLGQILAGQKEQILVPKDTDFSIVIPKIGASAKVFPNVDPADENAFIPILKEGVAHAKGTVFPGMRGTSYLFAHSTDNFWDVGRYNAIFYLLKDLHKGDEVTMFFEGKRYEYVITENRVGEANEVENLTKSRGLEQKLIMQTCWPPGTTWKRIFVTAVPKDSL